MMQVSKKIDYGVLILASLPEAGSQEFRSLQDVAQEKQLSAGYLQQLMIPLKKAGFVTSKEGLNGGYQLSRPSDQITLCEIYEAIEGPLSLTSCQPQAGCACSSSCPTKGLWNDLKTIVQDYFQHKRLSEFKSSLTS